MAALLGNLPTQGRREADSWIQRSRVVEDAMLKRANDRLTVARDRLAKQLWEAFADKENVKERTPWLNKEWADHAEKVMRVLFTSLASVTE